MEKNNVSQRCRFLFRLRASFFLIKWGFSITLDWGCFPLWPHHRRMEPRCFTEAEAEMEAADYVVLLLCLLVDSAPFIWLSVHNSSFYTMKEKRDRKEGLFTKAGDHSVEICRIFLPLRLYVETLIPKSKLYGGNETFKIDEIDFT